MTCTCDFHAEQSGNSAQMFNEIHNPTDFVCCKNVKIKLSSVSECSRSMITSNLLTSMYQGSLNIYRYNN